jgi:hypothetical protein
MFLALFVGLDMTFIPIDSGDMTLPSNLTGTVYATVSTSGTEVTDDVTVAGPTIFQFPDPMPAS